MKLSLLSSILVFLLAVFVQCGNSTSNDAELETDSNNLTEKLTEPQIEKETSDTDTHFNTDTSEIILFANMDRFIRAKDNISVLKGINTSVMSAILLKYIKNQHIDPNKVEKNITDSIFVDLITDDFSFVRKKLSSLTQYDVVSQREENVDKSLKNVKTYDRHIIKGKFTITKVKLDMATIEFEGKIIDLDAITYHYYGEDIPINENKFKDTFHIDLTEAFNDLGRMKKLTKHDLEVIDNKRLKYVRNQFFAQRGYIFKTDKMKDYFSKKEWYTPRYEDVSDSLSEIEKYNIELIKQLEEI